MGHFLVFKTARVSLPGIAFTSLDRRRIGILECSTDLAFFRCGNGNAHSIRGLCGFSVFDDTDSFYGFRQNCGGGMNNDLQKTIDSL